MRGSVPDGCCTSPPASPSKRLSPLASRNQRNPSCPLTRHHNKKYGTQQVVAAAPPATGGEYDFRLRNGAAPATNPGSIYVESDGGGVAGPFTVANG